MRVNKINDHHQKGRFFDLSPNSLSYCNSLKAGFHQQWSRSRSCKSAYDLVKIKNQSRKWRHKRNRIRVFPFLLTLLPTPSLTFRLRSSENHIVRVGSRSRRINQSQCMFPRFVIGLVLLPLLLTPTIWSSLDHKLNINGGVISGIGMLF